MIRGQFNKFFTNSFASKAANLACGATVVLSLSFVPARSSEPSFDIRTLADARKDLVYPKYTSEQKQLIANQALLFIKNMYVHRELKIKDFGKEVDPVPRLEAIAKEATKLSDQELHEKLQRVFLDLHDNHTNYSAPLPLGCSYVISPLNFKDAVENGKQVILFKGLTRILQGQPGEHSKVKPWDQLIAVDDVPVEEFMKTVHAESAGANPDAMTVYGLMNVTVRSLAALPIPKNDKVKYSFKGADGNYDVNVDLYAIVNEPNCAAQASGEDGFSLIEDSNSENPTIKIWKKFAEPIVPKKFADDILEEIANVQDIKTPAGPITYLQLMSFMPEKSSVDALVHRMRSELVKRQPDSVGLVIDLRGNGGGAVKLAEELLQLFTPSDIQPSTVRMLPNKLNLEMFLRSNGGAENAWTADIKDAIKKRKAYTSPRVLTTHSEANRIGQVWFKPVIVLTDAACYSGCDLFAAGMQDHAAAMVIGTHDSTGAGGANVMEYGAFTAVFGAEDPQNPFKKLPGGQSMRVSWRQSVRVGMHAGELIEDSGVKPDLVVRATREDLARGESFGVMKKIKEILGDLSPRYKSSTKLASSAKLKNGEPAAWIEDAVGVDTLEVFLDGKLMQKETLSKNGEKVSIKIDDVTGTWENKKFEVIGKLKDSVSFRVVRELFWRGQDIPMTDKGLQEDFSGELKYLKTNVTQGHANDGWQVSENTLRVGAGPNYGASVVTEAFMPIDISKIRGEIALVIDLDLQSEDGMDIFSIMVRDPASGEEQYVYTLDGTLSTQKPIAVKIPSMSKNMEVVFEFESDENWNMAGPIIKTLAVVKVPEMQPSEGGFLSRWFRRVFPKKGIHEPVGN